MRLTDLDDFVAFLPEGAGEIDRQLAASFPALMTRLRLQDMMVLAASVRRGGQSLATIAREEIGRLAVVASAVARVGHRPTPRLAISRNTSTSPPQPCSIVSTPATTARRSPSFVMAWAATGIPPRK